VAEAGWLIGKRGKLESPISNLVTAAGLLRQADFAHQFGKPRIRAQRIELEVGVQTNEQPIVLLISDVEPMESLLFISQVGVEASYGQR